MSISAFILAAGKGTRLLPFSESIPKPLLPILNKPLLEHSLLRLINAGIDIIGIIISKQENQIPTYIQRNFPDFGINFIVQEKPLGTAHAVLQIEKQLSTEDFLVIAGDSLFSSKFIKKLAKIHQKDINAITLSLEYMNFEQMRYSSTVEYQNGRVWQIREKPETPEQVLSKYNSSAFYAFKSGIFDILKGIEKSRRDEYEIATAINQTITQGHRVGGVITKRVCHISTPFDLWWHNMQFLSRTKKLAKNRNIIGSNVEIDASSTIKNSIIGDNTEVKQNLNINHTVVLSNSTIDRNYRNSLVKTPHFQEF